MTHDDMPWNDRPPRTAADDIADEARSAVSLLDELKNAVGEIDSRTVELYQDTGLHWSAVHERLERIAKATEAIKWGVFAILAFLVFSRFFL